MSDLFQNTFALKKTGRRSTSLAWAGAVLTGLLFFTSAAAVQSTDCGSEAQPAQDTSNMSDHKSSDKALKKEKNCAGFSVQKVGTETLSVADRTQLKINAETHQSKSLSKRKTGEEEEDDSVQETESEQAWETWRWAHKD